MFIAKLIVGTLTIAGLFFAVSTPRLLGQHGRLKAIGLVLMGLTGILAVERNSHIVTANAPLAASEPQTQRTSTPALPNVSKGQDRKDRPAEPIAPAAKSHEQNEVTGKKETVAFNLIAADFAKKFNTISASMGADIRASSSGCNASVRTACQFKISDHTGAITASDNDDPRATEVMIIHNPTGKVTQATADAVLSFAIVTKMLSPSIADGHGKLVMSMLSQLKNGTEGKAEADGVHYKVVKNDLGLWFFATLADD